MLYSRSIGSDVFETQGKEGDKEQTKKKTEEEVKCYRWRQSMNRLLHVLQVAHTLGEFVQLALVYSYGPVNIETLQK